MHPEIEKFLVKSYGEPVYYKYDTYWQKVDLNVYIMARRFPPDPQLMYPFYDGWKTEEQMLRLIKLKAFL